MGTIVKIFGIAVAALAVLFGVAALLLWVVFDPDNVREELEAFVTERTGREFYVDDDLALTLYPWLGIETGAMLLGHAAGFGDGDFASVDSAVARVRLLPLFRGRMEFGAVVLEGLELNLARDAEGRDNWSDLLGPAPEDGTDRALTSSEATPDALGSAINEPFFSEVDIAGIDIRNGIVFWRENIDEVRYVISDISLGTGPITTGMPIDIDVGLQWVSVQPAFTAQLDGRTSLVVDPESEGYRADDLRLQFRVEDGQSDERIAGNLQTSVTFDNPSRILRLDNLQLESALTDFTASTDPVDVTAVAPSLSVDTAAWTADVPEAVTTVGGITARWHVTAGNLADEPLFSGTVAVSESPADELLALLGVEHDESLGDFDLESEIQLEPLAGRAAFTGMTGSLLDMAVTGNFALGDTEISGDLEAPTFDPGVLFSVLPPEWLAGANVTGIEQLALSVDFTANRNDDSVSLREFAVAVPGAAVAGNLERPGDGDSFSGRIVASGVDPQVLVAVFPSLLPDALTPERLGPLGIDTTFDYDGAGSILRLDNLSASALGLQSSGDFTVRDPTDSPDVTGTLQVANFSPRALLERLGRDVPPTADPVALQEAVMSADIALGANGAEFAALQMRLDDSNVTGRLEVTEFADPHFVFELDVDRINLDRYLPPTSEAPTAPDEQDQGFDTAALADLNLAGRISTAELQISGLDLTGFSTGIELAEGIGRIEPLVADLYGGEFQGGAEFDVRAGGPLVSLQGSLYDVDITGLQTGLSGEPARTSGTGIVDVELTGVGDNLDEVLSTATGSIEFILRDGAMEGFNLDHTLCDLYNQLSGYPRPAPAAVNLTRYSLMRGAAQVRDGIAQTTELLGNMATIEVTGVGRVDLVNYGIDFDLDAEMTTGNRIPGCETMDGLVGRSIPVVVGGTVAEPSIGPDFGELLRQRLQEEAGEVILDAVLDLLN
ncbi:MAG: AsmA family protein [Rhodospirillaceae bacterium]|nr:AsmA family protein [Rhodospirillaceae bacterium]